jgi:hypothetical protein
MAIHLLRDIVFDHSPCGRTNAADGEVALKGFRLLLPDEVLQSALDAANHLCGRNMRFSADKKLAAVTGGETMFEDSDAIRFSGRLQEGESLIVWYWMLPPENCLPPVELARRRHVFLRRRWALEFSNWGSTGVKPCRYPHFSP